MIESIRHFLENYGLDSLSGAMGAIISAAIIGTTIWFWRKIPERWKVPVFLILIGFTGSALWLFWPNTTPVIISIASSSTKKEWMETAAHKFNLEKYRTSSGRIIKIQYRTTGKASDEKILHVNSGDSKNHILNNFLRNTSESDRSGKTIRPDVWSPGTIAWVDQFKKENPNLISKPCSKTIYSPIGIAMWKSRAKTLGWPNKSIGFRDIIQLAQAPEKVAAFRKKEWSNFNFGHPNPEYSNAGMLFMTALAHAVLKKAPDDQTIYSEEIRRASKALQLKTSRYDTVSTNLLDLLVDGELHAVWAFEEGVIRFNSSPLTHGSDRKEIVFIFPKEGTFWSEHPYCILDQAPWVIKNPDKIEGALKFKDFLLSAPIQKLAAVKRLRPILPQNYPVSHPLHKDPRLGNRPVVQFQSPNAVVSQRAIDLFWQTKRKVSVLLLIDKSGSMEEKVGRNKTKLSLAKSATENFIKELRVQDRVGVYAFSDEINRMWAVKERKAHWPEGKTVNIDTEKQPLVAEGGTALYHAICEGYKQLKKVRAIDRKNGENRIYGLIALSDGANNDTQYLQRIEGLWACIRPLQRTGPGRIRVNTIALGKSADDKKWAETLKEIADRTKGKVCTADPPHKLEDCYREINKQ